MNSNSADRRVADVVNLKDVLEIVEIINAHTDEDELIQAVLDKLLDYKMAAIVVFRRLSRDGIALEPFTTRDGGSPLEQLLQTRSAPLDSFEGHAIRTDQVVAIEVGSFPDVRLDPGYRAVVDECVTKGATAALFYPVRSTEAIGSLSFYSFDNLTLDDRGVDMFARGAKLLAFGIEKCRRLAEQHERGLELEAANVRLMSSNRDLQDFAHVASHDLQEPLRKIRTFSERLNRSAVDRLTEQSAGDLDQIQSAATRMQNLIDELLVYSRVGNRAGERVVVGLNAVLDGVVAGSQAKLQRLGATTKVGLLPAASVDEPQMVQLFTALLDNAVKFASPDRPLEVEVSGQLRHGQVTIVFADNGIGFEPEDADRIFEPFRRLHVRTDHHGAGMGLAVVRRIITRHDGTVVASSEPDKGTTFTLRFPAG